MVVSIHKGILFILVLAMCILNMGILKYVVLVILSSYSESTPNSNHNYAYTCIISIYIILYAMKL